MKKIDVRARINAILIIFILIILMPYAIWKSYNDGENLKNRGKETYAKVIDIKDLKGNNIVFEYEVNGVKVEKVKTAPSNHLLNIGNKLKIIYDSLNIENVKVIW